MKNKSTLFNYHIHDSRDLKAIVKKPIVDVIITSPPYWNLKNYNIENQIGFGQKYDQYIQDLMDVFKKCEEVLKDKGSMWIVADSFKIGGNVRLLPFELAEKLQKDVKLHLQDIIIWQKDKTLPWSAKGKLRNIFEYLLFFTKDKGKFKYHVDKLREIELKKWWVKYPERYNPKGKIPSRVWNISIPVQGSWGKSLVRHFCPFPPLLLEKILLLTTDPGDVVLDPFSGSGAVLAQAKVMKRKAIGFDLNKEYKDTYHKFTLPLFIQTWKERKKELKEIDRRRKVLQNTIIKLRQLKYIAILLKELKKVKSSSFMKEVLGVVVIGNVRKPQVKYFFLMANKNIRNKTKILIEVSNKEKLRKYSLKPEFLVINISKAKSKLRKFKIFYVYKNSITNFFKDKIKLNAIDSYIKGNNSEIPILLSNIKVERRTHCID